MKNIIINLLFLLIVCSSLVFSSEKENDIRIYTDGLYAGNPDVVLSCLTALSVYPEGMNPIFEYFLKLGDRGSASDKIGDVLYGYKEQPGFKERALEIIRSRADLHGGSKFKVLAALAVNDKNFDFSLLVEPFIQARGEAKHFNEQVSVNNIMTVLALDKRATALMPLIPIYAREIDTGFQKDIDVLTLIMTGISGERIPPNTELRRGDERASVIKMYMDSYDKWRKNGISK